MNEKIEAQIIWSAKHLEMLFFNYLGANGVI